MATIVFCEDSPIIQKLIRVSMRAMSHSIHVVSDGEAGLALIERERPDLVFTDVSMPGISGLELCGRLKALPHLAHIPVVFLSASVQRPQIAEALRYGGVDFLSKPFSPAGLRAKVEMHISGFRPAEA